MATVEHSTDTTLGRIPLARRILELMDERGEAFSARALAARIGMNRETFRLILTEERRIMPQDLERIAEGLNVSVERLKQVDIQENEQELNNILNAKKRTKTMMLRAQSIAKQLVEVALGATERGYSLNNLGRVKYLENQYDEAHKIWLSAMEYAKKNQEQYNDKKLLHLITANLMLTFSIRKEYAYIEELLLIVEEVFSDDPDKLGMVYFTRMTVQNDRGDLQSAKKYAYRSLEYYEQTNDNKRIGIALINVAHFEYFLGNYKTCARALSSALRMLEQYDNYLVIVVKDYVRVLMKLHDFKTAEHIIEQYESLALEYVDYWAKLQIMSTIIKDDPSYADRISNDSNLSYNIRALACECLFRFYVKKGEADIALKYYERVRIYSSDKSDFYDREGF